MKKITNPQKRFENIESSPYKVGELVMAVTLPLHKTDGKVMQATIKSALWEENNKKWRYKLKTNDYYIDLDDYSYYSCDLQKIF